MKRSASPKLLSLISGGIDSPVATHLMLAKGLDVVCVHFENQPFTDERHFEKTKKLVKKLAQMHKKKIKLHVVKHGAVIQELLKNCDQKSLCVLCRRMMLRVAEKIAEPEGALALLTGENLGQVASQTLDNLAVEREAVKLPVLAPLLGFDKEETIEIAKKIGTYDISIQPGVCCNATPRYPLTHAVLDEIKAEEKKVDIDKLVEKSLKSAKALEIR